MTQPVKDVYVTAEYGIKGSWSAGYHTGRDYRAPVGTPIFATKGGKVVGVGNVWGDAYGTQIVIQSGDVRHAYCHLSRAGVSVGQTVKAGQQIGLSGNTGNTTGPHLHYEERTSPFLYNNRDRRPVFPGESKPPKTKPDKFYSRAEWGARPATDGPGPLDPANVEGLAFHWPAMSEPLRGVAAASAALRGWQDYHMDNRGWSDIGYQAAIDQDGNLYELRGMATQSGANGDQDVNRRFGALLLILAPGEKPTAAMTARIKRWVRDFRKKYPKAARLVGHNEVRPEGTQCPGPIVSAMLAAGAFEPDAKAEPKPPKPPKTPKPRPDFTIGHCSGLWSAAPGDWREAVQAMKDAKATVITLTETTRDGLVKQIVPNGWDHARLDDEPGQSECSVLWSKRAWEDMGPAWATPLATTRFKTSKGFLRPPVTAITKPLRHKKTGLVVLFRVSHDPSGIQGRTGFKGTAPRLRAHREATEARHGAWAEGRAKYPDSAVVDAADRNVDWRLPWVRDWWAEEYPKLEACWEVRMPERGTFNDRVIDWTACSPQLVTVGAKVLASVGKFDHRPLVAAYAVVES